MVSRERSWKTRGAKRVSVVAVFWLAVGIANGGLRAQSPDPATPMPTDGVATDGVAPDEGQANGAMQASDPPSRVVRISVLQGDVSVEPVSVNQFAPAELNQVLTSGDRVYTDPSANAELEAGQIAVRLGGGADLTVTALTDGLAQFGLAAGSVHLRSYAIAPGTVLEVDSPEAAITVLQPGDVRVDEDAAGHATSVLVVSGQVQVDGPGISQRLNAGDQLRVHAADQEAGQAAYAEPLARENGDALDGFSDNRDSVYANGVAGSVDYLNPETTGGADLASYGSWDTGEDYGPVWFPVVAAGWRPFCNGHWAWVAPWGWTWVGAEAWGFAPFHYGRWVEIDGRWGWLPGTRAVKPVYAPAMVAFVGGRQFSASLGYGPGAGVAAWFPLGPREPYTPWYHGSTLYTNRVNVSNIYDPNAAEARAFYNQRAVNVYSNGPLASRTYANRTAGTVAMPETSFAAGQAAARNQVKIPPSQLALAPLLAHPMISPERSMVVSGPARAVPPQVERSSLAVGRAARDAGAVEGGNTVYATRPAFHQVQAPPPVARPNFEQQRQAMERTEPGRPTGPEQGINVRGSRPAGTPSGREAVTHPQSAPSKAAEPARSAPAPASSNLHH